MLKPRGYFRHGLPERTYRSFLQHAGFDEVQSTMAGAVAIVRAKKGP